MRRILSADIIKLPFQGAYRIIPFHTQGVAAGLGYKGLSALFPVRMGALQ
jgi:hypothetical protein